MQSELQLADGVPPVTLHFHFFFFFTENTQNCQLCINLTAQFGLNPVSGSALITASDLQNSEPTETENKLKGRVLRRNIKQ